MFAVCNFIVQAFQIGSWLFLVIIPVAAKVCPGLRKYKIIDAIYRVSIGMFEDVK